MQSISIRKGLVFAISIILIISAFSFTVSAIPSIEDHSPDTAGTGDNFIVNATISDDDGIDSAWVEYWFDLGSKTNVSMTNTGGDYWEYDNISIPLGSDDDLYYNISARNSTGVWSHLNNQQVVVTDDDLPTITNVQATPASVSQGGYVNITCDVDDNIDVDIVKVNISGPAGFTPVNTTMNGGYYYNTSYTIVGIYDYFIWVNDTSGNSNMSSLYQFTVITSDAPFIVDNSADVAGAGESFVVNATVTDDDGVSGVWVEYWFDGGSRTNESMIQVGTTDYYEKTIDIPSGSTDNLWYNISANDTYDVWSHLNSQQVVVTSINTSVDDISPYTQTSSPLTINATNNGDSVDNITLYYRYNTDNSSWGVETYTFGVPNSEFMNPTGHADEYDCVAYSSDRNSTRAYFSSDYNGTAQDITIRYYYGSGSDSKMKCALYYENETFIAETEEKTLPDGSGYGNVTFNFTGDKPEVYSDETYILAQWFDETGADYTFIDCRPDIDRFNYGDAEDYDNGVFPELLDDDDHALWDGWSLAIICHYTTGTSWVEWNDSSNPDTSSPWQWSFDFPNGTGYYEFYSVGEKSGFSDESAPASADAICYFNEDTTSPEITDVTDYPDPQEAGEYVNITCEVTDNVGVDEVWVNITYPDTSIHNFSMNPGSYYLNQTYSPVGTYNYFIWANDTNGNSNVSTGHSFDIQVMTPPEITNVDAQPNPQEVGGYVNITCEVIDNVGVDEVWVNITYPDSSYHNETMLGGSYFYNATTYTILGTYDYFIWANDTNGNSNVSTGHSFDIQVMTPPEITNVTDYPDPQDAGGYVNITCDVDDNVGVDEVWVNITYPDSSYHNFSMYDGSYYFNQTYMQLGTYNYFIWANDTNGNSNTSSVYDFVIQQDSTPPASITNLQNITGETWINWTWTNPPDLDFNYTMVYLNGTWMTNTSNPFYNATGLDLNVSYEIGTYTVDYVGNINTTWVNQTSKTLFLPVHNIDTGLNYSTIQAAIDASETNGGHTILVDHGTYTENVDVYKSLTIRSTSGNSSDTVVQAENSNDHVFEVTTDYVNISGFTVKDATELGMAGIYLTYADYCNLSDNNATNNYYGIYLYSSSNNTIVDNVANSNDENGIYLYMSSNGNTITNNIANSSGHNGIYLYVSSNNNTIANNIFNSNGMNNIYVRESNDNVIANNTVNDSEWGICLYISCNNTTIVNNTAMGNNPWGIWLGLSCNSNTIADNTATSNNYGIALRESSNNTIANNTANSNNNYGIYLYSSSNSNTIYNNYFNNTYNAWDDGNNIWNITKTSGTNIIGGAYLGGNYWSDYTGTDTDGDDLGDTNLPYNCSGNIQNGGDWLPLVFSIPDTTPPEITDVTDYPDPQEAGEYVNISCNVTDNIDVDEVFLNITYPDSSFENFSISANKTGNTYYCNRSYSQVGFYNYYIYANDTSGNANTSATYSFVIEDAIVWDVVLGFIGSDGVNDSLVFGEATDASDGQDSYDVPKPGTPPSPYIYAWFDANLSEPYDILMRDYRQYPDTFKVWDMYVYVENSNSSNVTISWDPSCLVDSEYSFVTLKDLNSDINTDMLLKSNYTYFASNISVRHFRIICSITPFEYYYKISLSDGWNLISLPVNQSFHKDNIVVNHLGVNYTWAQAVNNNTVLGFIYEWKAVIQNYDFTDILNPGDGYWVYAYDDCDLWISSITSSNDDYITDLLTGWNIVGLPYDTPFAKENLTIYYNEIEYTWQQAVNNNTVLEFIYEWKAVIQNYDFTDILNPGGGYWMYVYYNCTLLRPET